MSEKCVRCGDKLTPLNCVEENDFANHCSICQHELWADDHERPHEDGCEDEGDGE